VVDNNDNSSSGSNDENITAVTTDDDSNTQSTDITDVNNDSDTPVVNHIEMNSADNNNDPVDVSDNGGGDVIVDNNDEVHEVSNSGGHVSVIRNNEDETNEDDHDIAEDNKRDDQQPEIKEAFEIGELAIRAIHPSAIDKSLVDIPVDLSLSDGPKPPMSARMYLEANGGLSQSLITPSESNSYSIGGGLGVQLDKGRFSMNIGANVQWSFHDDLVLNGEAKVYGFGSEVYRYTLKYDEIYTLEGVISAGYRMGNHRINVGVRPSYVMNAKVGFTMNEEEVETERQMTYGYTEGLNRFGLKATLGYSFDFKGGVTLGANIGTRLLKSVDENYLNGMNNMLPIDGQIYIRKTLNFRK
jgi:hypothetical protein